jgi:hypothetical protein
MFDRFICDIIFTSCNIIYIRNFIVFLQAANRVFIVYSTVTDLAKLRG